MKRNTQSEHIQSINDPGWQGVNANAIKLTKNQHQDQDELDRLFLRVFTTDDGEKLLKHLQSKTIDQPAWIPGAEPSFGYAREGQNSIVREIKSRMERVKNG